MTALNRDLIPDFQSKSKDLNLDLSIILVSWNTRQLLKNCIESIYRTSQNLKIEVFVVDNASSDGSAEMIKMLFPLVCLIENIENKGFALANNQGVRKAKGRHIFFLNPDTIVLPGALTKLIDFLDTHPDAGAVAAQLLNADYSLQYSLRRFPTYLTPFTENPDLCFAPFMTQFTRLSKLNFWDHATLKEVDQPAGAAFMMKRSVIETLGSFDNHYHMFFEDVDLCYRIKKNGWKIFYLPNAKIIHFGGQSVRQHHNIGAEFYRSLLTYFRLHKGKLGERFARLSMVFVSFLYLFYAFFHFFKEPSHALWTLKASINVIRAGAGFFQVENH